MSAKTLMANTAVIAEVLELATELQQNQTRASALAKQKTVPANEVASAIYEYEETKESLVEAVGELYAGLSLFDPEDRELTTRLEEEEDDEEEDEGDDDSEDDESEDDAEDDED